MSRPRVVISQEAVAFRAEIEYALTQLLEFAGFASQAVDSCAGHPLDQDVVILYGESYKRGTPRPILQIRPSGFFGAKYLGKESIPTGPIPRYQDIPILFTTGNEAPYVTSDGQTIVTNMDLVASAFFVITQYEEYVVEARDPHARFPASASLASREGCLRVPIVNQYADLLRGWLSEAECDCPIRVLPGDRSFLLNVTHDVDRIALFSRVHRLVRAASHSVRRRDLRGVMRMLREYRDVRLRGAKDPFSRFDELLALERSLDATSTFFFMGGGRSRKYDGRYSMTEIRELVAEVEAASCEVALHGSYSSVADAEQLGVEKGEIEGIAAAPVMGNRHHYLRWKLPGSLGAIEQAGFRYDSTVGFSEDVGFRSGVCYPYRPFDLMSRRAMEWYELPLGIMEHALLAKMRMSGEEGVRVVEGMIDAVSKFGGVLTLLWHSHVFYPYPFREAKSMFCDILGYAKRKRGGLCSSREVLDQWDDAGGGPEPSCGAPWA